MLSSNPDAAAPSCAVATRAADLHNRSSSSNSIGDHGRRRGSSSSSNGSPAAAELAGKHPPGMLLCFAVMGHRLGGREGLPARRLPADQVLGAQLLNGEAEQRLAAGARRRRRVPEPQAPHQVAGDEGVHGCVLDLLGAEGWSLPIGQRHLRSRRRHHTATIISQIRLIVVGLEHH